MSGLTRAEMDERIAARDAERDRREAQIVRVMAITGIDRAGAEKAATDAKRMVAQMIAATRRTAPASFCALCTTDIPRPANSPPNWTPRQEPLGKDDALVSCCERCATERVPERDHLFSSTLGVGQDGVGYGNRHRGPQRR